MQFVMKIASFSDAKCADRFIGDWILGRQSLRQVIERCLHCLLEIW